jgi:perosamine synthetase
MFPYLRLADLSICGRTKCPVISDTGRTFFLRSGRHAIANILSRETANSKDEVLLPAYHCPSMVEPTKWCGVSPVFYPLDETLMPRKEALFELVNDNTRVVLLVNYFGIEKDFSELIDQLGRLNITTVVDCSHSYFCSDAFVRGELGKADYLVASQRKFFPIYDGGMLVARKGGSDDFRLESSGQVFNVKALANMLEYATGYGGMKLCRPLFALRDSLRSHGSTGGNKSAPVEEENVEVEEESFVDKRFSRDSRLVSMSTIAGVAMRLTNKHKLVESRRHNYRLLVSSFDGHFGESPLFPELRECNVPYLFALRVKQGNRLYPLLREKGIPVLRWDHLVTDICEVSNDFAESVIHLPCHQGMDERDVAKLTESVLEVMEVLG